MSTDDDILADAQRALQQNRDTLAREQAKRMANAPNGQRSGFAGVYDCMSTVAQVSASPRYSLCQQCRARIFGMERERGLCDLCVQWRSDRREHLRSAIPADFRWADLSRPLIPPGMDSVVVMEEGRRQALEWIASDAPLLTIVGSKTGSGKTTLAAAVANALIDAGSEPAWIRADLLNPEHPNQEDATSAFRAATRKKTAIIDGIGKEAGTAAAGSGVAAMRQPWVADIINGLHSIDGRRVVLTIDHDRQQLEAFYGASAVRRIVTRTNRVHVIALQRVSVIKPAEF